MGVSGVAIATTLSQTLTAVIVLTYLFKNKTAIKFKTSKLKIDFSLLKTNSLFWFTCWNTINAYNIFKYLP